jgi:hypothetical protein
VVVKLGDVMMIVDLHRKGLTVSAIARETGFDRKCQRAPKFPQDWALKIPYVSGGDGDQPWA